MNECSNLSRLNQVTEIDLSNAAQKKLQAFAHSFNYINVVNN